MPAVSKKQQRFFGMVRAAQKGEMENPSKEVLDVANDISMKDAKKFAKTKHKGLPEKKKVDECWKTHRKVGMKMKGGKLVPDCRPKNKKVNENVVLQDANGRNFVEIIDVIKPEPLVKTEESNPRIPRKKGQPANSKKHSDLYTDENPKGTIHGLGFKDVATAKASVSKIRNSSRSHAHKIQAAVAMEQRAREMGKASEAAVYRKYINAMKKKTKKMSEAYDANNFEKLKTKIGSAKKHRKPAVDEAANPAQQAAIAINMKKKGKKPKDMNEGSLHKWFKGSKSKDGKGGWVNVVTGGTCASDEPGEGTPKCVSSSKRASMSKAERLSAARRKKKADPGQQQKTGAAKPTYVSTDSPRKKMKEDFSADEIRQLTQGQGKRMSKEMRAKADAAIDRHNAMAKKRRERKEEVQLEMHDTPKNVKKIAKELDKAVEMHKSQAKRLRKAGIAEGADKKGKGSGTKDACYHKVKSRYSVWPSAYASGALVKCRKVGAANWGNSTKKEEFEGLLTFQQFQEKCWKGYEKKGMKTMFGKRYPNCVKKEELDTSNVTEESAAWQRKEGKKKSGGLNEKGRKSYERQNPGSDLKAPSKKVGNKRRASFCARMKGMKKKLTSAKTARDPDSRINKSLRAWNCQSIQISRYKIKCVARELFQTRLFSKH